MFRRKSTKKGDHLRLKKGALLTQVRAVLAVDEGDQHLRKHLLQLDKGEDL